MSIDTEIPEELEIYESIDIGMLTEVNIPKNKRQDVMAFLRVQKD